MIDLTVDGELRALAFQGVACVFMHQRFLRRIHYLLSPEKSTTKSNMCTLKGGKSRISLWATPKSRFSWECSGWPASVATRDHLNLLWSFIDTGAQASGAFDGAGGLDLVTQCPPPPSTNTHLWALIYHCNLNRIYRRD